MKTTQEVPAGEGSLDPIVRLIDIAIRLAKHPVNDLERVEIGQELIPFLEPGENVDTGALRILAEALDQVTEMHLCEVHHVVLRPSQLYMFSAAKGCEACTKDDIYSPNR